LAQKVGWYAPADLARNRTTYQFTSFQHFRFVPLFFIRCRGISAFFIFLAGEPLQVKLCRGIYSVLRRQTNWRGKYDTTRQNIWRGISSSEHVAFLIHCRGNMGSADFGIMLSHEFFYKKGRICSWEVQQASIVAILPSSFASRRAL